MLKLRLLRILGPSVGEKIANQIDFGEFRQIILYFGLSTELILNIELKVVW